MKTSFQVMLRRSAVVLFGLLSFPHVYAQSSDSLGFFKAERDVQTVLLMVMNYPDIVDYKSFKQQLETDITTLGNNPALPLAQRDSLKRAYCDTKAAYDKVFDRMKHDLLDFKTTQRMKKEPMAFASRYAMTFDSAKTSYQDHLRPQILRIQAAGSFKPIPPIVISLGIQGIKALVNYLSNRAELKNVSKTIMVNMVDTWFIDPIKMKGWDALVSYRPSPVASTATVGTGPKDAPVAISPETDLRIGVPTLNAALAGSIRLARYNPQTGKKDSLQLKTGNMKNISVRSLEDNSVHEQTPWSVSALNPVPKNSDLKIAVKTDCYVYVFALNVNEDGSSYGYPVYPYAPSRNITVASLGDLPSPVMDREPDGSLIIPRTPDGMPEQYMHVDGVTSSEELAIVFSRAEIDFSDMMNRINHSQGSLSDRLANVFGKQALSSSEVGLYNQAMFSTSFQTGKVAENAVVALTLHLDVK